MKKLPRSWLVLLQQLNTKLSVVKCRPLRNYPPLGWYARLPCYAELSREQKASNIKANTFRLFFFFKRQTCSTSDMFNCTHKVGAQFSVSLWKRQEKHNLGALFFFSLAMFSTADGSCGSRSKVWFITEDVSITDQTRRGVGTPLFGLDGYVLLNRVCRFSRPWVSSS